MIKFNDIYVENGLIASPGKADEKYEFPGAEVLPGFCDSHTHFVQYGLKQKRLNLEGVVSLDELYEKLKAWLEKETEAEVVVAEDWDESEWEESIFPDKETLNRIAPDRPVILRRVCGHIAVANDSALYLIPGSWDFVNREKGILKEDIVLKMNEVFPPSGNEIREAILRAQSDFISLGITSIHDIMIPDYFRSFKSLDDEGKLKLNVHAFITEEYIDELKDLNSGKKIELGGIKIFTDGSIGARTAAVDKYSYREGDKGISLHTVDELKESVNFANHNGYQLAIHAIGDSAIQMVLDSMEVNSEGNPERHRIEHFELATMSQIEEAIRKNLILSMQPNFLKWSRPGGLYERTLGEKWNESNRFSEIMIRGGHLTFGSDGMPYGPLFGINQAISAEFNSQRISRKSALRAYTRGGAYASFREKESGILEEGKRADLVIVDKDEVAMTVIDGRVEYSREEK